MKNEKIMQLDDFAFDLPNELIAKYPAQIRSKSRLLRMHADLRPSHHVFSDLIQWMEEGDLLVFNDTKVIPARLFGHKKTGGKVEVFVERILGDKKILAQVRASKTPKLDDELFFANDIRFIVAEKVQQFCILSFAGEENILSIIESIGQTPLPHYLHRAAEDADIERYQTVYAKHKGSVAAPTAGFHFDEVLLQQLKSKGVNLAYLTLHIGAGTFAPIRTQNIFEHRMHAEYLEVTEDLCTQIAKTKARGKRVIAVGTTSIRALETAAQNGILQPFRGETTIFIYPGYTFRVVDALITNFHLPSSTLLMLVCAFGGYEKVMQAYQEALQCRYRFYSYGDAMWVSCSTEKLSS